MIWLALLVAVLVAVATAAAVLGRVDGSLGDATTTMSHVPLPDDPLTPGDLDGLRFDTVTRGYRMSQVDAVVDRLRREISDLEGRLGEPATSTGLGAYARPSAPESAESTRSAESAATRSPDPESA
ncbi:MAG: DivIVA domain-containing protein [Lapillicoccus sp.]